MKINNHHHLAYCTNIHRGEDWPETLQTLERYTLRVKERVCPSDPYAIGLRLSARAAEQLSDPTTLKAFRHWLDRNDCYVFTINGFPYGSFHGGRVKEDVYRPDWTTRDRVDYTKRLFALLESILPESMEGSVSTVPCSFKPFIQNPEQERRMRSHLWECIEYLDELSQRSGRRFHLGLEPEPMCYLETSQETVDFFQRMRGDRPNDDRLRDYLGVNYDTCHLGVEFEEATQVVERFRSNQIRISKIHLSSALVMSPNEESLKQLEAFQEDVYLHQVVARDRHGSLRRFVDLPDALQWYRTSEAAEESIEWRIHFHIPLHAAPTSIYGNTTSHLTELLDLLQRHPEMCQHFEMETYTWEVLPEALKDRDVVNQLEKEYRWTLNEFGKRGLLQS